MVSQNYIVVAFKKTQNNDSIRTFLDDFKELSTLNTPTLFETNKIFPWINYEMTVTPLIVTQTITSPPQVS